MDAETGPEANGTGPASPAEARAPGPGEAARVSVPRPALGALAGDPRLPLWIGRAVLAAAAGIAVMVWQGWRLGVTAAAFIAIADTIYRSKTAAVQVTTAQRRTRRRLFLLRPAGYVALHRRVIPGSDSVIDHLVIGPAACSPWIPSAGTAGCRSGGCPPARSTTGRSARRTGCGTRPGSPRRRPAS